MPMTLDIPRTPEQLLDAAYHDLVDARAWLRLGRQDLARELIREARILRRCARRIQRLFGRA